jgi:hypothetical protein
MRKRKTKITLATPMGLLSDQRTIDATREHDNKEVAERTLVAEALDAQLVRSGDVTIAMNKVCTRLSAYLTRWIGSAGWHAILERALFEGAGASPRILPLGSSIELHWIDESTPAAQRAVCIGILEAVVVVLGRFVGRAMALRLTENGLVHDINDGDRDDD